MATIESVILEKIDTVFTQAMNAAFFTTAVGDKLLTFFLIFIIVWKGIEFMLVDKDGGEVIFDFIKLLFFWGIIKWILNDYETLVGQLLDGFKTISTTIRTEMGWAAPAGSSFNEQTEALMRLLEKTVDNLLRMDGVGVTNAAKAITYAIAAIIMTLAMFLLYLAYAVYTGVSLFMTIVVKIYILIGVLMGPFMIPFLLFNFLSWIGDGWVRFMITAGFMSVLITVFGVLIDAIGSAYIVSIIQRIESTMRRAGGADASSWTSENSLSVANALQLTDLMLMLVVFGVMAYLLLQIPTITEMLLAGRGLGSGASGASRGASGDAGKGMSALKKKFSK